MRQFTAFDQPDKRDYSFTEFMELASGASDIRPRHEVTVFDQGQSSECTRYALGHIYNGNNILEYQKNNQIFAQINPHQWREKGIKFKSLQSALNEFKKRGLIEGYTVIPKDANVIENIRKSLAAGMFIYTGSENGLWGIYKSPRNYMKRKDGKIVGHAWSIIGDEPNNNRFVVINSFGEDWGDSGYFYLPYEDIKYTFSLNSIVDKDDSGLFKIFRNKQKAKQMKDLAKQIYGDCDEETKAYFDNIQLSKFLTNKYGL